MIHGFSHPYTDIHEWIDLPVPIGERGEEELPPPGPYRYITIDIIYKISLKYT